MKCPFESSTATSTETSVALAEKVAVGFGTSLFFPYWEGIFGRSGSAGGFETLDGATLDEDELDALGAGVTAAGLSEESLGGFCFFGFATVSLPPTMGP